MVKLLQAEKSGFKIYLCECNHKVSIARGKAAICTYCGKILAQADVSIDLTDRARVRELLYRVGAAGAVSIYLYGNKYGYRLNGINFNGIIKD
jgi:hypothetical protein